MAHTVILSSHILSEVQEVCDQVLIINHGKLIASGSPTELEQRLAGSTLSLTVKGEDAQAVHNLLSALDGVTDLSVSPSANAGELDVQLSCHRGSDVREAVSSACIAAGIPILMMKSADVSLEQIFLEVTSDDPAAQSGEDAGTEAAAGPDAPAGDAPEEQNTGADQTAAEGEEEQQ